MQEQEMTGVTDTCTNCGQDLGGLIWEGYALRGLLRATDIVTLTNGGLDVRTVGRMFRGRQFHGLKPGKCWLVRASQFITDWEALERSASTSFSRRLARGRNVVEVVR